MDTESLQEELEMEKHYFCHLVPFLSVSYTQSTQSSATTCFAHCIYSIVDSNLQNLACTVAVFKLFLSDDPL